MLHPDTELKKVSDAVGYGVFATARIPRGTITWALDPLDQVIDRQRLESLEEQFGGDFARYVWLTENDECILTWDFMRFMNHSCEANTFSPGGFPFEMAIRDIEAGEQLTSDYGAFNLEDPLPCLCGSPRCRGLVQPGDFDVMASHWDDAIQNAFQHIVQVNQPLWKWVAPYERDITRLAHNPTLVPSILRHRWPRRRLAMAAGANG